MPGKSTHLHPLYCPCTVFGQIAVMWCKKVISVQVKIQWMLIKHAWNDGASILFSPQMWILIKNMFKHLQTKDTQVTPDATQHVTLEPSSPRAEQAGTGRQERASGYLSLEILPSRELTYPPKKWHFEDDFPFPKVGYVNSLEGIFLSCLVRLCL